MNGSVPNMCTLKGHQCKIVTIQGLRTLVHPNQTWTFRINDIIIKILKYTKYELGFFFCIFSRDGAVTARYLSIESILLIYCHEILQLPLRLPTHIMLQFQNCRQMLEFSQDICHVVENIIFEPLYLPNCSRKT